MAGVKRIAPRLKAVLPPIPNGWFEREYANLLDGSLARLEATFDINEALRARHDQGMTGQHPQGPWPPYPSDTKQRISTFGAHEPATSGEFIVDEIFARFDRLSDGNWIVADCRCGVVESNARIIDAGGGTLSRLLVGDGLEVLQCDADGKIWVGYFDEGIFGNNGWGFDGPSPVGQAGINCFDRDGTIVWPDAAQIGKAAWPLPFIADCYVMNVTRDAVWICPYTDFPIVRIASDRSVTTWGNEKHGASILAVESDRAVLLGGYNEAKCHAVLLDLKGEVAKHMGAFEIDMGVEDPRMLPFAGARGSVMNFVAEGGWYQLTVQDVMRELS